jgi:hypothetical protein
LVDKYGKNGTVSPQDGEDVLQNLTPQPLSRTERGQNLASQDRWFAGGFKTHPYKGQMMADGDICKGKCRRCRRCRSGQPDFVWPSLPRNFDSIIGFNFLFHDKRFTMT